MATSRRKKKDRGGPKAESQDTPQEIPIEADGGEAAAGEDPKDTVEYWREQVLRAQADLQNIRRRAEQDVEERVRRRLEGLLFDLIRVADYMDAAVAGIPASVREAEQADAFLMGIHAIQQALEAVMTGHGMEIVAPPAEAVFDPELHEAVETETDPSLETPQLVLLARGYRLGRTILRPAKVRLLSPPTPEGERAAEDAPAKDE